MEGKHNSSATSPLSLNNEMLEVLFYNELKEIYGVEKYLLKFTNKRFDTGISDELKNVISNNERKFHEHIEKLEQVFNLLGKKAKAKKSEAMEALVSETKLAIENTATGTEAREAGLIIALHKIVHYKIATYGGLLQLAKTLRLPSVAKLLKQTLWNENETDNRLSVFVEENADIVEEEKAGSAIF